MSAGYSEQAVWIAGGTGGLGRAVSLAFLQQGANVTVTYMLQEEFDALQQAAGSGSARLRGHVADVTDEAAVSALVTTLVAEQGAPDALVNTVGGYAGGAPLWETEPGLFDKMLALNLRTGYALARAVMPAMLARKRGAIVNIAARAAVDHPAGAGVYAASKAAALALFDSLAADLKGTGVRVNTVLPSIIDTPANRKAMPRANFALWPKPEDIACVILFLCSSEARVIHGAAIPVYGNT